MNDIVAFIFARGGSKGLPRKNLLNFCGKPLIAWSIEQARSVAQIDRVIVSTDDEEIAETARRYGAEVPFMRPVELAQDNSPEWLAWRHGLEFLKESNGVYPKVMVSIPTTSPLRSLLDIENCINLYLKEKPDAVITVTAANRNPYFNMVQQDEHGFSVLVCQNENHVFNRQQAPEVFDITTVAYVLRPEFVLNHNTIFDGTLRHVVVPHERAIDIDNQFDFDLAEFIYKRGQQKAFL